MDEFDPDRTAVYLRRSTAEQDEKHQRDDVAEWLERRDLRIGDVHVFAEQASGASGQREGFLALIESVESDELDHVVVWEVSRIARRGLLAQRLFEACEEHGCVIHITHGSVREVRPDGTGRMVAGIIAEVAAEERRTLIRRTRSGQRRARKEGKWLGQVPLGFVRSDGYLSPNLQPDYSNGETGFLDVVDALEQIDDGMSYRQAAQQTPNVTRQTLSNIDQSEERRRWYLEGKADDERVESAVQDVT
jgi:DNA invertase Pin-like site-specific DNA recombinase